MRSIKKLLYWIIVGDIFLIALSMNMGVNWLISSQAAFLSSLVVTLASFYAYKNLISKRVEQGDIPPEFRDEFDTIDDRYELFEEDEAKDIKSVIKEQRGKFSIKRSAQSVAKTLTAIISPLRIASYIFLVLTFLYLNRHEYLEIWGYISGLLVVPLVATLMGRRVL